MLIIKRKKTNVRLLCIVGIKFHTRKEKKKENC